MDLAGVILSFVQRCNPLRVTGTALPPNLLLVAKLVVFLLFIKGYVARLPAPWLPMWRVFDAFPPGVVRVGLRTAFTVGAMALFTNHFVRVASLSCGLVFLLEPLVARVGFFYANIFCAFILILIGLYRTPAGLRLIQAQFVVMYFGSGLNKLLDPDWRSGHFMDFWLGDFINSQRYHLVAGWFPEGWFTFILCWGTILIEIALAFILFFPRWRRFGIWLAIVFHLSSLLLVRNQFGIFIGVLLFSFLVFVPWPLAGEVKIKYHDRTFSRFLRFVSRVVHFDDLLRWHKWPEREGGKRFMLELQGKTYTGVSALNKWVSLNPFFYFVFAFLISTQLIPWQVRKEVVEALLVFSVIWFFPVTAWLFEKVTRVRERVSA